MRCERADALAAAYALGALDADEERRLSEHLASCAEPHTDARELIGAGAAVGASVDPVQPSAALRSRLMATVAATPQEHRAAHTLRADPTPIRTVAERRPWWSPRLVPTAIAAGALTVAVGLGAWNLSLNQQLADRSEALRLVAVADAAHRVSGSAGAGWVLETDGRAVFLADALADLPPDRLYELWLIGPEGAPVAVGTLTDTDGVAVVELERPLGSATTFAVTVEAERVDAPTTEPVLAASIEG